MTLYREELLDFDDALYHTVCDVCGDPLEWELNPDPDVPRYWAFCSGRQYTLTVETVKLSVEDEGD